MKKLAAGVVVFAACENFMRKMNVTKTDLLPFAMPVESGVAELARKQKAGWSYLKGGRVVPRRTSEDHYVDWHFRTHPIRRAVDRRV
jgi:hypothetical protein